MASALKNLAQISVLFPLMKHLQTSFFQVYRDNSEVPRRTTSMGPLWPGINKGVVEYYCWMKLWSMPADHRMISGILGDGPLFSSMPTRSINAGSYHSISCVLPSQKVLKLSINRHVPTSMKTISILHQGSSFFKTFSAKYGSGRGLVNGESKLKFYKSIIHYV